MAHHDHHTHRTPDDEYLVTPEGSTYEHTDANVWVIAKFGIWLAVTAIIVHLGIGLLWRGLVDQATETNEQQYPLATSIDPKLPPEPRLQQYPRDEVYTFRLNEEEKLHSYGYVNKEAGIVRIPIEEAMRLTVERGLPSRTEDPAHPATPPGMMPTKSSSGRVMERRRQ
jgi:hypothetical protein